MTSIAERLALVQREIAAEEVRAGRRPKSVNLLAVSKKQPVERILEAYAAGQRDFGENYAQELVEKAAAISHLPDLRWHLIGHLQRNKARHVASLVSCIHSVDDPRLVQELERRLDGHSLEPARRLFQEDPKLPVFVEVNVGREAQKHGSAPEDLASTLQAVEQSHALRLAGLMTVPPNDPDPEAARACFRELRALRDRHGGPQRLADLSMGMTLDFRQAIAEGATWVRIGTWIFGERAPS